MRKKRRRHSNPLLGFIRKLFMLVLILCVGAAVGLVITGQWEEPYQAAKDTIDRWLHVESTDESAEDTAVETTDDSSQDVQNLQQPDSGEANVPIQQVDAQVEDAQVEEVQQPVQMGPEEGVAGQLLGQAALTEFSPVQLLEVMHGIEILPESMWSMQQWLEEEQQLGPAGPNELSLALSIVYEAALRSGLEIGERHIHHQWDQRFKPGFDVAFEFERADLEIYNPNSFSVTLQLNQTGQAVVSWIGDVKEPWQAPVLTVEVEVFEPEELLIDNAQMLPGQERRVEQGEPGQLIKVYRQVAGEGERQLVAKDFYAPTPAVIHRGVQLDEGSIAVNQEGIDHATW